MRSSLLISIFCVFIGYALCAQTTVSKWEWNLTSTVHPPSKIKQTVGEDKIQIRPSSGWEFGLAYEIFASEKYKLDIGYCRGSTPLYLYIKLAMSDYTMLRRDYASSFYTVQHPYNSFYFRVRRSVCNNATVGVEIANRFYSSSYASTGIEGYNSYNGGQLSIFRSLSITKSNFYFSPHLKLSFTGTIWKRFPSFLYEASLCYAPISVIDGFFVLFPNSPGYTSSGTFQVQQSYLGLGIKYRRVRKVKKE
jgi:hypothetical protein